MITSGMIYGSSKSKIKYGHVEGYAVFHNTTTGNLPSTMYPLMQFYRNMTMYLLVIFAGWYMACRTNVDKKPAIITDGISFIHRATLFWFLDAFFHLLALTILNAMQVDFRSFKDFNNDTMGNVSIKTSVIVLICSSAVRDGFSFFWLSKFGLDHGPTGIVYLSKTVLQFLWGLYTVFRAVFSLGILWTFSDFNGDWLVTGFPIFFIGPFAVAVPSLILLMSHFNGAKRNLCYKSGLFFKLG